MELWATDGTVAGTGMVSDIFPSANGSFPSNLTSHNGKLMFVANDTVHGQASCGASDGDYSPEPRWSRISIRCMKAR